MKHTQQFIEDALAGGWERSSQMTMEYSDGVYHYSFNHFLDPKLWQAVGKTRGWGNGMHDYENGVIHWKRYWHRFIDALADGKSIEDALSAIST